MDFEPGWLKRFAVGANDEVHFTSDLDSFHSLYVNVRDTRGDVLLVL